MNLVLEEVDLFHWRERIPFYRRRDGFTGERERVRMLLSLVAHADEDSDDGRRPQYC